MVGNGVFCSVARKGLGSLRVNRLVDWEPDSFTSYLISCESKSKRRRRKRRRKQLVLNLSPDGPSYRSAYLDSRSFGPLSGVESFSRAANMTTPMLMLLPGV
jgi:hypothetical protein